RVFCASPLPSTPGDNLFVKCEQNVDDLSEDFIIPDPIPPTTETLFSQEELASVTSPSALVFEGDLAIQEQLKTFFILKTVLKFPTETLCEILRDEGGENHDQSRQWSPQLCRSCEVLVSQFYETFKQLSKLQRKLTRMDEELRGKIHESKDKAIDSKTGKIRSQVILVDKIIPQPEVPHSDNFIETNNFFEAETPPETGDNTLDIEYAFIKVECQDNQDDFNGTKVFSQDSTPEEESHDFNSNEQTPPQFKSPLKKAQEQRNTGGARSRMHPWKPSVSDGSRCPKCKKELSSIKDHTNRYRHILNCGQTFKCPFCPCFYTRKDNLRTHMRKCSKIKSPSNIMIKGD
ncbi:Protein tramtrack, beta isoform, partial [Orchesella cincta]